MSETPDTSTPQVLRPRMRTLGKILAGLSPVILVTGIIGAGFGWHELIVDGTRVVGIFALSSGLLLVLLSDPPRDPTSATGGSSDHESKDGRGVTRSRPALVLFLISAGFIAALLVYTATTEDDDYLVVFAIMAGAGVFCLAGWYLQLRHGRRGR